MTVILAKRKSEIYIYIYVLNLLQDTYSNAIKVHIYALNELYLLLCTLVYFIFHIWQ